MKKAIFTISILFYFPIFLMASADDFFRNTGKIYAVVAVILILFIALIVYLVRLDKKIAELEKQLKNEP